MTEEDKQPEDWNPGPEDITIRQVQWAWLMTSLPWIIVTFALIQFGWIEDGTGGMMIGSVILLIVIIPRFFMWRRTSYTISDEVLVYQRGGIMSSKPYPLPYTRMTSVRSRPGLFGRAFGYQAVDVMMDNGAVATLSYIPILTDAEDRIKEKIEEYGNILELEDDAADSDPDMENEPGSETDNQGSDETGRSKSS